MSNILDITKCKLNPDSNVLWGNLIGDINAQADLVNLVSDKQDKLIAGENIVIEGNVISAIDRQGVSKEYVDSEISRVESEIPSLDGYATESWVNEQGFLKEHQDITGKADVSYVNSEISRVESEIPSLDGYATESWVNEQGFLTEHQDITGKADVSYVDSQISSVVSQIPSLEGYATESWVNEQGFLTEHQDISGKQDVLTPGDNITIENNVISSTAQGLTPEQEESIEPLQKDNVRLGLLTAKGLSDSPEVWDRWDDMDYMREFNGHLWYIHPNVGYFYKFNEETYQFEQGLPFPEDYTPNGSRCFRGVSGNLYDDEFGKLFSLNPETGEYTQYEVSEHSNIEWGSSTRHYITTEQNVYNINPDNGNAWIFDETLMDFSPVTLPNVPQYACENTIYYGQGENRIYYTYNTSTNEWYWLDEKHLQFVHEYTPPFSTITEAGYYVGGEYMVSDGDNILAYTYSDKKMYRNNDGSWQLIKTLNDSLFPTKVLFKDIVLWNGNSSNYILSLTGRVSEVSWENPQGLDLITVYGGEIKGDIKAVKYELTDGSSSEIHLGSRGISRENYGETGFYVDDHGYRLYGNGQISGILDITGKTSINGNTAATIADIPVNENRITVGKIFSPDDETPWLDFCSSAADMFEWNGTIHYHINYGPDDNWEYNATTTEWVKNGQGLMSGAYDGRNTFVLEDNLFYMQGDGNIYVLGESGWETVPISGEFYYSGSQFSQMGWKDNEGNVYFLDMKFQYDGESISVIQMNVDGALWPDAIVPSPEGVYMFYEYSMYKLEITEDTIRPKQCGSFRNYFQNTGAPFYAEGHYYWPFDGNFYQVNPESYYEDNIVSQTPEGFGYSSSLFKYFDTISSVYAAKSENVHGLVYGLEYSKPVVPETDGTYTLTCTVVNGKPTYSWVSGE